MTAATPVDGAPVMRLDADLERVKRHLKNPGVRLSAEDALLAALLQGKLVRAGDRIGALRVKDVSGHAVRLQYGDEEIQVDFQARGGDRSRQGNDASRSNPDAYEVDDR